MSLKLPRDGAVVSGGAAHEEKRPGGDAEVVFAFEEVEGVAENVGQQFTVEEGYGDGEREGRRRRGRRSPAGPLLRKGDEVGAAGADGDWGAVVGHEALMFGGGSMEPPAASGVAAVGDMAVADYLEGCLGVGTRSG